MRQQAIYRHLERIFSKPYTPQNVSYHLKILEKADLIEKKAVAKIGNARINEISLNPAQLQRIRPLLGIKVENNTLITGFGELGQGYCLPDKVFRVLKENGIRITRVVCFTSRKALKIRQEKEATEALLPIHRCLDGFEYLTDFCNLDSSLYQTDIEQVIREELQTADVFLDLTPMSKLYSFKLLEFANQYQLPCFFLGNRKKETEVLVWMTGMKLEGTMNSFRVSLSERSRRDASPAP